MGKMLPEVDAYIEKSAEFAQPILEHLRGLVHKAVPEVEEAIKWGMPYFYLKGEPLCAMAAFKAHCAFGFWKAPLITTPGVISPDANGMSSIGKIASKKDLPKVAALTAALKEAVALNEAGVKSTVRSLKPKALDAIPPDFQAALKKNRTAQKQFEAFPPGKRRDYAVWINEAKTDATRERRIGEAVGWIAEGKSRNWKYEKKK